MGSNLGKKTTSHLIKKRDSRRTTISTSNILDVYEFGNKILGQGHFGTVRVARSLGTKAPYFAVKSIRKERIAHNMKLLQRELELFRDLDHPNIVNFYEMYEDSKYFHIVMEYCSGGELMDKFIKERIFNEEEAAKILFKAFSAVKYLHDRDIVHRDIKPANFLYENKEVDAEIKLIDFGLSRYCEPQETLKSQVGTPYYTAPEVLAGSYDRRCDYWSLGVMMYVLLSGYPPFDARHTPELVNKIMHKDPDFTSGRWATISPLAKDLVAGLLKKDPKRRVTAEKAMLHPWMKKMLKKTDIEHERIEHALENIRHFSLKEKLKKEAFQVMVAQVNSQEIKNLREVFQYFDKHNTGEISVADFKKVKKEQKLKIKGKELKQIMKSIHVDEATTISFSEFLFVAMDPSVYLSEKMLSAAFSRFDVDKTGHITANSLKEAMTRSGKYVNWQEVEQMMAETQCVKNGAINFEDFCGMMRGEGAPDGNKHEKMKLYLINEWPNTADTIVSLK